jgi:secreted trypsin-like serine protease
VRLSHGTVLAGRCDWWRAAAHPCPESAALSPFDRDAAPGHRSVGRVIKARMLAVLAAALAFAPAAPAAADHTPLIVGGTAAPAGAWPSIAFLEGRFEDPDGNRHLYHCTGSVVAPAWIITAAHCAFGNPGQPPDSMDVTLGVTDYTDPSRQVIAVDRFVPDPSYDSNRDVNDIALVHLVHPTALPGMRLATTDEATAGRYISDPTVPNAAGWGAIDQDGDTFTTELQQAYLQIHSTSECEQLIPGFDDATQTCAGTIDRTAVCFGDSGGPLVKLDAATRQPVLWGITSSRPEFDDGTAPCSPSIPAQFTWIPAFTQFIQSTLTGTPNPAPTDEANAVSESITPSSCRRARTALARARKTERTALQRLRTARRHHMGRTPRRRIARRYYAAHSRTRRAAATVRRACRPAA